MIDLCFYSDVMKKQHESFSDELMEPMESDEWVIPAIGETKPGEVHVRTVETSESGWRLDLFLAHHFPNYSRTLIRAAIQNGGVCIEQESKKPTAGKPSFRLKPDQVVRFTLPEIPREAPQPEPIPLDILYEDNDIVVVNKPVNMVVHPSRGHWSGTLVAALAYHFGGQLSTVRGPVRPGIVHRLDRDTTGVILVAKNDVIHAKLATLFEQRQIHKEYFAIVFGCPHLDRDMIDAPIGLHPKVREKMCIAAPNDPNAKEAQTFYEVIKRYGKMATIRCLPKTGRTHQIRVHLAFTGYPILCDRMYGGRKMITQEEIFGKLPIAASDDYPAGTVLLNRQALHAHKLTFVHPETGKKLEIVAPIPPDMKAVIDCLERNVKNV
ncbi:MAG: RluA family pseudouridine synthase [Planctomycetaceae bacterium]|jgi:23S rRNA pseudouridine1911/1915/1917 synthase|nr:RluA family pseudouridine synthase [Planctomycetaceae bacterium]